MVLAFLVLQASLLGSGQPSTGLLEVSLGQALALGSLSLFPGTLLWLIWHACDFFTSWLMKQLDSEA